MISYSDHERLVIVHDADPEQYEAHSVVQVRGCPYIVTALEPSQTPGQVEVIGQRLLA